MPFRIDSAISVRHFASSEVSETNASVVACRFHMSPVPVSSFVSASADSANGPSVRGDREALRLQGVAPVEVRAPSLRAQRGETVDRMRSARRPPAEMHTRGLPGGRDRPPKGKPVLRRWNQRVVGGVAGWSHRDGATLCALASGRLLLIGGWDPAAPWTIPAPSGGKTGWPGWAGSNPITTTNEVWATDDLGATWEKILWDSNEGALGAAAAGRPKSPFPRVHTPASTYCGDGYFYLIGGDVQGPHSEVWRTSLYYRNKRKYPTPSPPFDEPDYGDGTKWERMTDFIHEDWGDRVFSMAGSIGTTLYLMGGQTYLGYASVDAARNDVYKSEDGGRTWVKIFGALGTESKPEPPWSPRGMVYGMPVIGGKLYLVGGGIYDVIPPHYYDGVYSLDGVTEEWTEERADTSPADPDRWPTGRFGTSEEKSGRGYHNVVRTSDGRLWVFTGSIDGAGSCPGILVSDDLGKNWDLFGLVDWGEGGGSHADGITAVGDAIYRASGTAGDRSTYKIAPQWVPPKPVVKRVYNLSDWAERPLGPLKGAKVRIEGENFEHGVLAVFVSGGRLDNRYAVIHTWDSKNIEATLPAWPVPATLPVFVVGPGGTGYNLADVTFQYK